MSRRRTRAVATPPVATQATLWNVAPTTPARAKPVTLQGRFDAFDAAHPEIYAAFTRIARSLLARGVTRYGAKSIAEIIRYHAALRGGLDSDGFKLNNSYVSRYSRKLMAEDTRFSSFFETRSLKSA